MIQAGVGVGAPGAEAQRPKGGPGHVGQVGQDAGVQGGVVGQALPGPEPAAAGRGVGPVGPARRGPELPDVEGEGHLDAFELLGPGDIGGHGQLVARPRSSGTWNEQVMRKVVRPSTSVVTSRVVKDRPSRTRSTRWVEVDPGRDGRRKYPCRECTSSPSATGASGGVQGLSHHHPAEGAVATPPIRAGGDEDLAPVGAGRLLPGRDGRHQFGHGARHELGLVYLHDGRRVRFTPPGRRRWRSPGRPGRPWRCPRGSAAPAR